MRVSIRIKRTWEHADVVLEGKPKMVLELLDTLRKVVKRVEYE